MKQTDHREKKPQPKEGTGRKTALLGGNSRLGDSRNRGISGKAATPVPTSPMLSLPHPQQSALCQTPDGKRHWMPWHRRKPSHRVNGDSQRRCGGSPTLHLAALSHPCHRQAVANSRVSQGISNRQQYGQITKENHYQKKRHHIQRE